ncbi:amidohydrolase family protein [Verticiella sediminum]|uniref:Amidohydrolase family protein n=1 Tax=Verticiella sediminum TaxID=1247510 RepID=A0A556AJ72_9BURK|nr:amidohydrolase family protein [Verticiella sediminum]TSH92952.1 amidohydrolase family protein [Verticiella sediminum]
MNLPTCPPAAPTQPPSWPCAGDGWDAHAHVFGPVSAFPYGSARRYTPPEQTVEDYLANLDRLGLRHGVLVQPSVYGDDNAALVDALQRADGRLLGVVQMNALAVDDRQMAQWHDAGVRGVRLWWDGPGRAGELAGMAARLRGTGWHLDVYASDAAALASFLPHVERLTLPVMVEAMGSPRAEDTHSPESFQTLLAMLREGSLWAKLSHPYKIDPGGLPYPRARPWAQALARAAPSQLVWGSDWPHPMIAGPMPHDGALLDLLPEWAGGVEVARRILQDNPARFYLGEI